MATWTDSKPLFEKHPPDPPGTRNPGQHRPRDLEGGWLMLFIDRVICFFGGHRPDMEITLHNHPLIDQAPYPNYYLSAHLLLCFRCGAVRVASVSGPVRLP